MSTSHPLNQAVIAQALYDLRNGQLRRCKAMGVALWQELMASTSTPVNLLADLHAIELQRITLNMQISLTHGIARHALECASRMAQAEATYLRRVHGHVASIPTTPKKSP